MEDVQQQCSDVNVVEKRKQFGTRYLTDESETFNFNAWDSVEWSDEQKAEAEAKVAEQHLHALNTNAAKNLLQNPNQQWQTFYEKHEQKFFMNRNWILTEFPELDTLNKELSKPLQVLEVGCGAGNTVFPLLTDPKSAQVFVHCCDYSSKAIEIVKQNPNYDENRCHAFVWDVTGDVSAAAVLPESLDIISCIYVLSAIPPELQKNALENFYKLLKPGGILLFKDYGQYDMTQLRFKKDRLINDNFYCRGDGTLVYFFTQDQLDNLFVSVGLSKVINVLDRRLIVNRAKRLKMYRIWIQCKYKKS